MNLKNRFFQLKLKLTDFKLRLKRFVPALRESLKSAKSGTVKKALRKLIFSVKPFFAKTPLNLKDWNGETTSGKIRCSLLFLFLGVIFGIAGYSYAFTANDAFVSFRYVSNAVKGWGYTFNPPPFEPVSGFTSFLWLTVLHLMWKAGLKPPFSADLATYLFSMGQVFICFLFVRRMSFQQRLQSKSILLFFAVCLILTTNRTFLAFMTSGTDAALFNFLVLWWTFEATSGKDRNALFMSVPAILLALCRFEGFIFIQATVILQLSFLFQKKEKFKTFLGLISLFSVSFYYNWLNKTYGSTVPNSVIAFYNAPFPAFGKDYLLSFVLEYALYFWLPFLAIWSVRKFLYPHQKGRLQVLLLLTTFAAYICYYLLFTGGDVLEYKPFGFFIPLCSLAGVRMLSENIVRSTRSILLWMFVYVLLASAIPQTHRELTKDLNTRSQTAFLYQPVAQKTGLFGLFAKQFDKAQQNLISQGIGLRHQEHKVLTEELLKTFPTREEGSRLKKEANRFFTWNFVGVAGWILPEAMIIDLSGQNNFIIARAPLKNPYRRLSGFERNIPDGYAQCFNGGNHFGLEPFSGKKNLRLLPTALLTDGKIKGCENFWKAQIVPDDFHPFRRRKN